MEELSKGQKMKKAYIGAILLTLGIGLLLWQYQDTKDVWTEVTNDA